MCLWGNLKARKGYDYRSNKQQQQQQQKKLRIFTNPCEEILVKNKHSVPIFVYSSSKNIICCITEWMVTLLINVFLGQCKYVTCSWNDWSKWSATCGASTRQRTSKVTNHVINRPSCSGLQTTCPQPQDERRTTNCKYNKIIDWENLLDFLHDKPCRVLRPFRS